METQRESGQTPTTMNNTNEPTTLDLMQQHIDLLKDKVKALQKRNAELEAAIESALRIKDLWYFEEYDIKHEGEMQAIGKMYDLFCELTSKP